MKHDALQASRICEIDTCNHRTEYVVAGYPDDVGLCAEHLQDACECWDSGVWLADCPIHGNPAGRARVRKVAGAS